MPATVPIGTTEIRRMLSEAEILAQEVKTKRAAFFQAWETLEETFKSPEAALIPDGSPTIPEFEQQYREAKEDLYLKVCKITDALDYCVWIAGMEDFCGEINARLSVLIFE